MKTRTLAMIKPNALFLADTILALIHDNNFTILAQKTIQLTKEEAAYFYAEHKNKDFFDEMITRMSSGPVLMLLLEKEDAVQDYRKLLGKTDPQKAEPGTIRNRFGTSKRNNVAHGSDSDESAQREIAFVFPEYIWLEWCCIASVFFITCGLQNKKKTVCNIHTVSNFL